MVQSVPTGEKTPVAAVAFPLLPMLSVHTLPEPGVGTSADASTVMLCRDRTDDVLQIKTQQTQEVRKLTRGRQMQDLGKTTVSGSSSGVCLGVFGAFERVMGTWS